MPSRSDFTSLPWSAMPASQLSSRWYLKRAWRLVAMSPGRAAGALRVAAAAHRLRPAGRLEVDPPARRLDRVHRHRDRVAEPQRAGRCLRPISAVRSSFRSYQSPRMRRTGRKPSQARRRPPPGSKLTNAPASITPRHLALELLLPAPLDAASCSSRKARQTSSASRSSAIASRSVAVQCDGDLARARAPAAGPPPRRASPAARGARRGRGSGGSAR